MDTKAAVTAFAALAQPSRLAVVRLLVEGSPQGANPGELAARRAIPANTLSFHLRALGQAGLVSAEPCGRNVRYRANISVVQSLVGFLSDHCCGPRRAPTRAARKASRPPRAAARP